MPRKSGEHEDVPPASEDVFAALRAKWTDVPVGDERLSTKELLRLGDHELIEYWTERRRRYSASVSYSHEFWHFHHELYADSFRGKRVLDVGSGIGFDGMTFAEVGAQVTCFDVAKSNLALLERIARGLSLEVRFLYMESLEALRTLPEFDVIWAIGSLITVPFEFARSESAELVRHLRVGGRWIELAYPKSRWEREGNPSFSEWGEMTDGPGTPWMEWYDLDKLLRRLAPAEFEVVLDLPEFRDGQFNWFDLCRRA